MNTASYTDTTIVIRTFLALTVVVLAVASGACAARSGGPAVPRPFPGAALPPGAGETAAGPPVTVPALVPSLGPALVNTALEFRGVPYRNGGSDPSGFDCSGFVQYVYAKFGTTLPREVHEQYRAGTSVDLDEVEAGDLLFFETVGRGASHVGMVVGGGQFVHAPSSRGVVRVERYDAAYWATRFVGARRIAAN